MRSVRNIATSVIGSIITTLLGLGFVISCFLLAVHVRNGFDHPVFIPNSGYSGSLKKSLIFEGNYIVTASPQQKASDDLTSKKGEEMQARIVGTAKIHGEPPVPVDAVSVPAK
jgi:hypothetical protein